MTIARAGIVCRAYVGETPCQECLTPLRIVVPKASEGLVSHGPNRGEVLTEFGFAPGEIEALVASGAAVAA